MYGHDGSALRELFVVARRNAQRRADAIAFDLGAVIGTSVAMLVAFIAREEAFYLIHERAMLITIVLAVSCGVERSILDVSAFKRSADLVGTEAGGAQAINRVC